MHPLILLLGALSTSAYSYSLVACLFLPLYGVPTITSILLIQQSIQSISGVRAGRRRIPSLSPCLSRYQLTPRTNCSWTRLHNPQPVPWLPWTMQSIPEIRSFLYPKPLQCRSSVFVQYQRDLRLFHTTDASRSYHFTTDL